MADKLGIPVAYLRRLRAEHLALYDANVNGWLRGVIENEPCPVSEFDSTNPANTSGLSAPRAPVNGGDVVP